MAWDEDKKALAVKMYKDREPTADNSVEIVQEVADELGESPNGVRMILIKADAYIKKTQSETKSKTTSNTGTKMSKEAAQAALIACLEEKGKEVDADIISKLTGKAAVYFTTILS